MQKMIVVGMLVEKKSVKGFPLGKWVEVEIHQEGGLGELSGVINMGRIDRPVGL